MTKHDMFEKLIVAHGSLLFAIGRMQDETDEKARKLYCDNLERSANNILTVLLNLVDEESK